ncbi:NAD(P)-binding protein [Basidiobolus meristosporus CBS 931.73]|uniref:NAD(P)-binding protein n=1 Tax=Basidiobolus meristosporus CBS 931.73 TaxID=1314790 RepID=A0A1Y1YUX4_9FUNG|nr:NAD(P)-binding protein [Basidiobolus meristosporus CBS 931.73]|eukprot:ORY01537.1 NAD(P)-binding protein [Basidiobolus meristosporus CBS 931.73]
MLHYIKCLLAYLLFDGTPPLIVHCPTPSAHPAVMLTRAGSGAGRDIALSLGKQGYTVIAGIRNQKEGEDLEMLFQEALLNEPNLIGKAGRILPVMVDLSAPSTIVETRNVIVNHLKEMELPLVALINNTGLNICLPNELASQAYVKHALEVRLFGVVKLTQALVPSLRESQGRIINIGSITQWMLYRDSGNHGPTKKTVDLISEVWQHELRQVGVVSCMVEPGVYRSAIHDPSQKIVTEDFVDLAETIFTDQLNDALLKYYIDGLDEMSTRIEHLARVAPTSEQVIHALVHGLTSRWPKNVYTVGWDAHIQKLIKLIIGRKRSVP